jgi:hyperosmotically inducible periplasmic protein
MQIQHKHYNARRMGSLGALLGCLIAATGCASDQEARRGETTTARERAHDHREARRDRDRDRDGVRDDREVVNAREAELDENVAVKPVAIANASDVRDNVGEREPVQDNVRDRNGVDRDRDGVRDGDANRTDNDRALTSRIRKSIVDDDELSTKAKNVEIISNNGAVTLRGPVTTTAEKTRLESHAEKQAGAKRVTNQIEVVR